jgi:hypothetical protein
MGLQRQWSEVLIVNSRSIWQHPSGKPKVQGLQWLSQGRIEWTWKTLVLKVKRSWSLSGEMKQIKT